MDFEKLKKNALKLKDKAVGLKDKAVGAGASKLWKSKNILDTTEKLDEFIKKSKNRQSQAWKEVIARCIIIFAEKDSDFYKDALYMFPVIYTKAWTQNIALAISNLKIAELDKYGIKETPTMLVFENEKVLKTLEWRENIKKVVKAMTLDINKTVDNL